MFSLLSIFLQHSAFVLYGVIMEATVGWWIVSLAKQLNITFHYADNAKPPNASQGLSLLLPGLCCHLQYWWPSVTNKTTQYVCLQTLIAENRENQPKPDLSHLTHTIIPITKGHKLFTKLFSVHNTLRTVITCSFQLYSQAKNCHGWYVFPKSMERSSTHRSGRGELANLMSTYATWKSWEEQKEFKC